MNMSMPELTPTRTWVGRSGAVRDLVDALPVRDHEAAEAELTLELVRDELVVGVHLERVADPILGPVHAGERRHHAAGVVPAQGATDTGPRRCQNSSWLVIVMPWSIVYVAGGIAVYSVSPSPA